MVAMTSGTSSAFKDELGILEKTALQKKTALQTEATPAKILDGLATKQSNDLESTIVGTGAVNKANATVSQGPAPPTQDKFTKQTGIRIPATLSDSSPKISTTATKFAGSSWTRKALIGAAGGVALVGGRMALRSMGYNMLHLPYVDHALDRAVVAATPYAANAWREAGNKLSTLSMKNLKDAGNQSLEFLEQKIYGGGPLQTLSCTQSFGSQQDIDCLRYKKFLIGANFPVNRQTISELVSGNYKRFNAAFKTFKLTQHPDKGGSAAIFREGFETGKNFLGIFKKQNQSLMRDLCKDAPQNAYLFSTFGRNPEKACEKLVASSRGLFDYLHYKP